MEIKRETITDYVIYKYPDQYLLCRDNSFVNSRNSFSFTSDFSTATGFKDYSEAKSFLYENLDTSGYSSDYKIKEREITINYNLID